MTVTVGPQWEQISYANQWLARQTRLKSVDDFEPGDIASCYGSITATFYQYLKRLGYPLDIWELADREITQLPYRYCIIKRRVERNLYEVFLITTFGDARSQETLGPVGAYFGIPMGNTQWVTTIPSLKTTPPVFGRTRKSFVFAIPALKTVEPANMLTQVRLVPGELDRILKFVEENAKNIHRDQKKFRIVFKELKKRQDNPINSITDDFKPRAYIDTRNRVHPIIYPDLSRRSPKFHARRLKIPGSLDISWLVYHSTQDIINASQYLNTIASFRPRRLTLPEPYYAPCFRVGIQTIGRLIH
ncbi:hypothetical protein B0H34DRAFT_795142 [Crassisporium funariophilum]|nr:hypothetical protein B0H34DRAFT_795142 [Crassisporium funariophilum]